MKKNECLSCSQCELNGEHNCRYCEAKPTFCRAHFIQHLASDHFGNQEAEYDLSRTARETKYPEGHPCKWHEGDEPIIQDPDPENYLAPGCCNCGAMYPTRDCEDTSIGKGCGLEFLDWENRGFDDVIAGPYVTTGGDLYCQRCGPRMDEAEEDEFDREYEYDHESPY